VVELRLRSAGDIERICRAENYETAQALASLAGADIDVAALGDLLTDEGLVDFVTEHSIDNHNSQLVGLVVNLRSKELLLQRLRSCTSKEMEERAKRDPGLMERVRESPIMTRIGDIMWGVLLGVLGNAVFQYVVVPLIAKLSETHMEDVVSKRRLDLEAMLSTFPVLRCLSADKPRTVSALAAETGAPRWSVAMQTNELARRGIVKVRGNEVLLVTSAEFEPRAFVETGFHPGAPSPMPIRRYHRIISGLSANG